MTFGSSFLHWICHIVPCMTRDTPRLDPCDSRKRIPRFFQIEDTRTVLNLHPRQKRSRLSCLLILCWMGHSNGTAESRDNQQRQTTINHIRMILTLEMASIVINHLMYDIGISRKRANLVNSIKMFDGRDHLLHPSSCNTKDRVPIPLIATL